MKFVLGRPHEGSTTCWYLIIKGEDATKFAHDIILSSVSRIASDPHIEHATTGVHYIHRQSLLKCTHKLFLSTMLDERYEWYMNKIGGMCPNLFSIEKELELDHFPNEGDRIIVSKFPEGKHWYATVDCQEVMDKDGINKWNTQEEAHRQARKFIKNIGI